MSDNLDETQIKNLKDFLSISDNFEQNYMLFVENNWDPKKVRVEFRKL